MSFAIFKTGGKQYKVQASEILKIEKLELSKDNKIEFNEKLLEDKYLYLCFKNTPESRAIKNASDKGAHKVDMKSFFNESLR